MKSLKLKKIVAVALVALTVSALSPVGASAAWKQDSNGWWNTEGSSYSIGWKSIDGSWYYFDTNGYMKTGWVNDAGTWYYMQPSGAMKTGWVNDGGTWYYLQSSGAMKTGWVNDGGVWYYAAASGAMQTGVVEVDGKVYYLAPSGAMQIGNVTINGVVYTFAASGEAIGDKIPTPTKVFSGSGVEKTPGSTDSTDSSSNQGSSSNGGGGGGSHKNFQTIINQKYSAERQVTLSKESGNLLKVTLNSSFVPETKSIKINGKDCVVKKDLYVTLNGTDAGISGNYVDGYKIEKSGTVTVSAVITVFDTTTGVAYYVTSEPKTLEF